MAGRTTDFEQRLRVDEVYTLLLGRVGYNDILRHCSVKWGVSRRSADLYISKATALVRKVASEMDHTEALGKAVADYDMIFARQISDGDLRGACTTLDRIVALLGLASPQKAEVDLTFGNREQREAELVERITQAILPSVLKEAEDITADEPT